MTRIHISILLTLLPLLCLLEATKAQQPHREATITFTTQKPTIDGNLNDEAWQKAVPLVSYTQHIPNRLAPARMSTEVRLLYDNSSIYVYGRMEDTAATKIARQLGARDSYDNPQCDIFSVGFSPYNDGITSYYFMVSAAGVQSDQKVTGTLFDLSWNAVWYSAVKIDDRGWSVEMEIPLTQLRFSSKNSVWGFNQWRLIKRNNEWDTFNPVDINIQGINNQEANLSGFNQLEMPFRLSLSPYLSYTNEWSNKRTDNTLKGGVDLRYGISDAFTLDMMTIPDFSQVRSDDIQLNLTTVEQRFDENRQFFTEGSELFSRAGIFYSRRIGGTPINIDRINQKIGPGEYVSQLPATTSMINATKISGRTTEGLGVGFLNAVTGSTYATITNRETGTTRKENIQPLTNYNVSVVDLPLRNSSYISAINASMVMPNSRFTFNNTATEFYLANNRQSYAVKGSAQLALQSDSGRVGNNGFAYSVSALKTAGNLRAEISNTLYSDTYNPSYMGYIEQNNRIITFGKVEYISYDGRAASKYRRLTLNATHEMLYHPTRYSRFEATLQGAVTYRNEFHHELETSITPITKYDYFEPRHSGFKYAEPRAVWIGYTFNTDMRKTLAISRCMIGYWIADRYGKSALYLQMNPTLRIGNRLSSSIGFFGTFNQNAIGYAEDEAGSGLPIFGRRDTRNYEQSAELRYIISKNAFTNLRARYNWTCVHYKQFYHLKEDGWVDGIDFLPNRDISYTSATIEMSMVWNFAPGSQLSLMYRKNFDEYQHIEPTGYFDNLQRLSGMPQRDLLSFRLIYFWTCRRSSRTAT